MALPSSTGAGAARLDVGLEDGPLRGGDVGGRDGFEGGFTEGDGPGGPEARSVSLVGWFTIARPPLPSAGGVSIDG